MNLELFPAIEAVVSGAQVPCLLQGLDFVPIWVQQDGMTLQSSQSSLLLLSLSIPDILFTENRLLFDLHPPFIFFYHRLFNDSSLHGSDSMASLSRGIQCHGGYSEGIWSVKVNQSLLAHTVTEGDDGGEKQIK